MSAGFGRFAGKLAFASTQSGVPPVYLTSWTPDQQSPAGTTLRLPAMLAQQVTEQERCILYSQPGGTLRIQLGDLLWIALLPKSSWLQLVDDPAQAADFVLTGDPPGRRWQVHTQSGLATVYYTVDPFSPILTTTGGGGALDLFAPLVITPSLDQIVASKSCPRGDLRHVALQGADLSGVDFGAADFSHADLTGAPLAGATLTKAVFADAVLAGVKCDGARLDAADFTGAHLTGVAWGSPASALRIVLTRCRARGAVLGGQQTPLDCSNAIMTQGDFRGADLRGLLLGKAQAGGAILAGCKLDKAVLDGANLQDAVAVGASLRGASLRAVVAQGASFVGADLSNADLTRARMGAKAYLFTIPGSFAEELDTRPYPQPDLVAAFAANGVVIAPQNPVEVLAPGQSWLIDNSNGPYKLTKNPAAAIDVFSASPGLRPAVLRDAICQGTKAPGASLAGADLRHVSWFDSGATLDHADLEGASLAASLLAATDFTQAYLDGADFSGCVLAQARFRGCLIGPDQNRRPVSFEGALLQGADFSAATLLSALLVDAAVAVRWGVPLFRLPASDAQYLTSSGIGNLASVFAKEGYPLGSGPTVSQVKSWLLDNHADPHQNMPRTYWAQLAATQVNVYDGDSAKFLFKLAATTAGYFANPAAPAQLSQAFGQAGYSLAAGAPITARPFWEIRVGSGAARPKAAAYPRLRVLPGTAELPVYGGVLVDLRDWPQYPGGLAFTATQALGSALNPASLGPAGYPRAWVEQGLLDWETFLTANEAP